ncbi:hypothetical protein [Flavobacterium sp.]|uniref:hypothetical protein n=1 Tax=Flavobacterium sp. TaxID=239 RepID=UPI0039E22656
MMRFQMMCLLMIGCCIGGCASRLSKRSVKFNPYQKGDTLVFRSNSGDRDTIFITSVEKVMMPGPPLAVFPIRTQILQVMARKTDSNFQRYLENPLLEIDNTMVDFYLWTRGGTFYNGSFFDLAALQKMPRSTQTIGGKTYEDIIAIKSPNTEYQSRSNFIETLYWSISSGFVKYELRNGKVWELQATGGQ